jgi:hypothetical protein
MQKLLWIGLAAGLGVWFGASATSPAPAPARAVSAPAPQPAARAATTPAVPSFAAAPAAPAPSALEARVAALERTSEVHPPDDPVVDGDAWAADAAIDLNRQLAEERVDPKWSATMNTRIQGFFAEDSLAGVSVTGVDCRSTLCKVAVRIDTEAGRERLIADASRMLEPDAEALLHIEGDADPQIEVYMTRMGHALPLAEM